MKETAMSLKQLNIRRIKKFLKDKQEGTKISIASGTDLSVATCGNLLKELLLTGQVIELPLASSTGGRPSRRFKYNADYAYIGCIYINNDSQSTHIAYNVVNLIGETIHVGSHPCHEISIAELEHVTSLLVDAYPQISDLCYGIPGVISHGNILSCDYQELTRFDLKGYFFEKYHRTIYVEKDINATALGFFVRHTKSENENLSYLFYPKDFSPCAGFIINGEILRGYTNFVGEVGQMSHIILNPSSLEDTYIDPQSQLITNVVKTIMNINCTINPKYIVFAGRRFDQLSSEMIQVELRSNIAADHMPIIIYEEDIYSDYVYGLALMAMDV